MMSTVINSYMNLLSKYTRNGVCVLNKNQSGMTLIQDIPISKLILNKCNEAKFPSTIQVEGQGENVANHIFTPLINLWDSHGNSFNNIIQRGLGVTDELFYGADTHPYYLREEWNKYTPSGIDIRGEANYINNLNSFRIHDSFIISGERNTIANQFTDTFSGDDGFIQASNFTLDFSTTINSIKTLPYELKHRDVKQIASPHSELTGIHIAGQYYRDGNHLLSLSPDGIIIHTDGILNHSSFAGVDIISDTPEHGVSSVCMKNSYISTILLQTKTNAAIPSISLRDRKGYGISENNIIETDDKTMLDVDDTLNTVNINARF